MFLFSLDLCQVNRVWNLHVHVSLVSKLVRLVRLGHTQKGHTIQYIAIEPCLISCYLLTTIDIGLTSGLPIFGGKSTWLIVTQQRHPRRITNNTQKPKTTPLALLFAFAAPRSSGRSSSKASIECGGSLFFGVEIVWGL